MVSFTLVCYAARLFSAGIFISFWEYEKRGASPSIICSSAQCEKVEVSTGGSSFMESAVSGLVGLERCAAIRETRYRNSIATQAIQKALDPIV